MEDSEGDCPKGKKQPVGNDKMKTNGKPKSKFLLSDITGSDFDSCIQEVETKLEGNQLNGFIPSFPPANAEAEMRSVTQAQIQEDQARFETEIYEDDGEPGDPFYIEFL